MTVYVVREWYVDGDGEPSQRYLGVTQVLVQAMLMAQDDADKTLEGWQSGADAYAESPKDHPWCWRCADQVESYEPKLNMPGMPDMFEICWGDCFDGGPYHEIIAEEV